MFALSFCPVSAALFFGSLIPLLYGIGTSVPVIAFALFLGAGSQLFGRAFDKVTRLESRARKATALAQTKASAKLKIIGVSCSARKDKTTAAAVRACLDAAKSANPAIETEFIDLGGLHMQGDLAAGIPLAEGERDDFPAVEAKLHAEGSRESLVGTPVYFSGMSSLCKQFLDRWMTFRTKLALRNVVGGAIAVGAARNGGQELTLQSIHAAMLCQDMINVSEGKSSSLLGGMLVSAKDEISHDEAGLNTVRSLGRRVGEVAQLIRN